MKRFFLLTIVTAMLFVGLNVGAALDGSKFKAGIVLGLGGLGDKSFNDSAFRGLEMAKKNFGIKYKYVEPTSNAENAQYLRLFAEGGYNLTIATGFLMKNDCAVVAKEFPKNKFAIIDETVDAPNVVSLVFKEEQGAFLVGALAGLMTKTNIIGFVGGAEVYLIKKFEEGYKQGAKYVNPKIKVLTLYTSGPNPFGDPVQGKLNATSEIKQGADILFHAAGGTGVGVIEAAKENKVYVIGCDSNQDDVAPGTVLTSLIKNVDVAVSTTIKKMLEGKFTPGIEKFGLKENGVSLTDFKNTKDKIPAKVFDKLDDIKKKIINGEINIQL